MRRAVVVASIAVVALLAASCSSSSKSSTAASSGATPEAVVSNALAAFTGGKSGKVTLTVFGSAADLNAEISSGPNDKNAATAGKLLGNSQASMAFERGSTATNGKVDVDITVGGEDKAINLVYVDQVAYVRADVKGLSTATGAKLDKDVASLSSELPFLTTIAAGDYISLDFSTGTGKSLAPVVLGGLGKLPAALASTLLTGTTVTKVGSDSTGDHYRIVGQSRQYAQGVQTDLSALPPPLGSLVGNVSGDVSKIPERPITIDAWVSGGTIKQLEVDIRQFHTGPGGAANPVGVKLAFSGSSGGISAPSKATAVDLAKLAPLLSMLGNSSTTTTVK